MRIKRVLLVVKRGVLKAPVVRILEERGLRIVKSNPDWVLSIGGDGAVLRAAKYNKPILALNAGDLGFLTQGSITDLEKALRQVLKGRFKLESRMMLQARVGRKQLEALNDIIIATTPGKALRLRLFVGKDELARAISDGLVVSTPTGSTGYNLSVGGPVIEPGLPAFVVSAISPHLSKFKPVVLSMKRKLYVKFTKEDANIRVVADGLATLPVKHSQTVKIEVSKRKAKLIILRTEYFASLRRLFT